MVLMEAYGCDRCQRILALNLEQQALYRLDVSPAQGWRWQGQRWRSLHHQPQFSPLSLVLLSLVLVICPAGLVALAAYLFPPLESSGNVSWAWAGLTVISHGLMVAWLMAEFYQVPVARLLPIRRR